MKSNKIRCLLLTSLCCATLLLSSTTIAIPNGVSNNQPVYNITSKIYVDGELISSPIMIVRANQKASFLIADKMTKKNNQTSMSSHVLKLELIANEITSDKHVDIAINYDMHYQNGTKKMHYKPKIILTPNQESAINISESGHIYEIRAVAKRQ